MNWIFLQRPGLPGRNLQAGVSQILFDNAITELKRNNGEFIGGHDRYL